MPSWVSDVLNQVPNGTIATLPLLSMAAGSVFSPGLENQPLPISSWYICMALTTSGSVYFALPVASLSYRSGLVPTSSCSNHTNENSVDVWYIGVTPLL